MKLRRTLRHTTIILLLGACAMSLLPATASAAMRTLRVGTVSPFTDKGTLDPAYAYEDQTLDVQRAMLEPLYDISPTGTLVPRLAAGQPRWGRGHRTLTIRLRSARWSDGRPVTSADVATALQRARGAKHYLTSFVDVVTKVSTPNSRTVVLKLSSADPTLPAMLTTQVFTPVPTHVIRRAKSRWTRPRTMVSSGPFVLTAASRTTISMRRNARYFGARSVRLAGIRFAATSKAALTGSMRAGSLDVVLRGSLTPLDSNLGSTFTGWPARDRTMTYAYVNTRSPQLGDARVRRALALAIDRSAIASARSGAIARTVVPSTIPAPASARATALALSADGAPATDAATALLAAASWPAARSLTIAFPDEDASRIIANHLRDSLAAAGVASTLRPIAIDKYFTVGIGLSPVRTEFDITIQGWIADMPDRQNFLWLWWCKGVQLGLNSSNYCDSTYDSKVTQLFAAFGAARWSTMRTLETRLVGPQGTFPALPLYEPRSIQFVRTGVSAAARPNASNVIRWDLVRVAG